MVLVGITFILTELHRYQVYKAEKNSHIVILNNKEVNKISGQILQIELIKQTEMYGMYEYGTYLCEITEAGYQRLKEEQ